MPDLSPRLSLPLLAAGQAQKEITHNEALLRLDALVQPVVEAVGLSAPPAAPLPGQCWIVGTGATGDWAGQDHALAQWTDGGWRFAILPTGRDVWSGADSLTARRTPSGWDIGIVMAAGLRIGGQQVVGTRQPGISDPAGGASVDAEARVAVQAILATLRAHGLIAP